MYCVNQIRPPDIESCNNHACEYIWITGEWTEVRVREAVSHLPDVTGCKILIVQRQFIYSIHTFDFSDVVRTEVFPVRNSDDISCWWFILSSSAQPAVARATASVWSPAVRCMWRMTTMSTAISLCPTAPGPPLKATCLVIWAHAHHYRSGGLESGDWWASPCF